MLVLSSNSSASRAWKGAVTPVSSAHNERKTHISQRGRAGTKGARLCPQDQPQRAGTAQRVGVKQESPAVPTRCGWCSRLRGAPKRRYGATEGHTAALRKIVAARDDFHGY